MTTFFFFPFFYIVPYDEAFYLWVVAHATVLLPTFQIEPLFLPFPHLCMRYVFR